MALELAGRFIQHHHCAILWRRPTQVKHVAQEPGSKNIEQKVGRGEYIYEGSC
jgi:hypothetical protein